MILVWLTNLCLRLLLIWYCSIGSNNTIVHEWTCSITQLIWFHASRESK